MPHRAPRSITHRLMTAAGLATLAGSALTSPAIADSTPTILQWFEMPWREMEYRAPDLFIAGYSAVWVPPPSRARSTQSVGFDTFDRFDLGRPGAPTTYGTELEFQAVNRELNRAGAFFYIDTVLNHNSGRETSAQFQAEGGYPGFWLDSDTPPVDKAPTSSWGDFHGGNAFGYLQSTNPGGGNYSLWEGDLVALVDIDQRTNNQFIRQPIEDGNPLNLPAGTIRNRPNPANIRFYPDRDLPAQTINVPPTSRSGGITLEFYPFNTTDPAAGDAVAENATGYLMRWLQWMLEVQGVDGFRLDALKHTYPFFWDQFFDGAVHNRWTNPAGGLSTPFSFGENTTDNVTINNTYVRKDGFANRDSLDLAGAGQLRNLVGAGGFASWQPLLNDVFGGHLDIAADGFNNGSLGVNHVFSHDNGSVGDGGSPPPLPTLRQQGFFANAYVLLRPGPAIIYHNARGVTRPGGFWVREGNPSALGLDRATGALDDRITTLVGIRNTHARGLFLPRNSTDPSNQSVDDVLIYERVSNNVGNLLVGVNDRYDAGLDTRNVQTAFAPGTRLHELTGNAADPAIDPTNAIPEVLVVDSSGRVTITVPRNSSTAGEHHGGYVAYGPAVPTATLQVLPAASTITPDPIATPDFAQRLAEIDVVTADSFTIRLTTSQTDPLDPATDDNAAFRINEGYVDYNGNGQIDFTPFDVYSPGYETFTDVNQPLFGSGNSFGQYDQTIDATQLAEGYHYISAIAFRNRPAGTAPLFSDSRKVIYLDRVGPALDVPDADGFLTADTETIEIFNEDLTATDVHVFYDLPQSADPVSLTSLFNRAQEWDRGEFRFNVTTGSHGFHRLTIVAFETSGNVSVSDFEVFVDKCDVDLSSATQPGIKDGILSGADFFEFLDRFSQGDLSVDFSSPTQPGFSDGALTGADFFWFLQLFTAGCP